MFTADCQHENHWMNIYNMSTECQNQKWDYRWLWTFDYFVNIQVFIYCVLAFTKMEFIELIHINKLDGVILKYPHQETVDGTVCITGHHLILSSRKEGVHELWVCLSEFLHIF